jgi:acyl carrier protein
MTREELFTKVASVLHETFELSLEKVKPEARLYEDLDIDSIDAVDLLVRMKPLLGQRRLQPEAFKSVRTVQDVVEALYQLLAEPPAPAP